MPTSEARILANRQNASLSTGPKTAEGKARSRQNGVKHGLAGTGVVLPGLDAAEVDSRTRLLILDLNPRSAAGVLVLQALALSSVQMDRAGRQESDAIARNIRHAVDDFDEARHAEATRLFDELADDPRNNLRRLKRTPEGVERLLEEWGRLRDDLSNEPKPIWTADHLVRAATMTGLDGDRARNSKLGMISNAFWGDATAAAAGRTIIEDDAEADADTDADSDRDIDAEAEARRWGRAMLLERIDAEVAALEEHYETLDFDRLECDRAEAPGRSLFDTSKEATLARRYATAAHRVFFKSLAEYRKVEAEAADRAEAQPPSPTTPPPATTPTPKSPQPQREPARASSSLGSPRTTTQPGDFGDAWPLLEGLGPDPTTARCADGRPLSVGIAPKRPG